jgi:hypothetical protein
MTCSRTLAITLAAGLTVVSPAVLSAQTRASRVTVSVLTTREHVTVDNGEGTTAGAGAIVSLRMARFVSLQGEITAGSGEAFDSYSGVFQTLAAPSASVEEKERLGLELRRDRMWKSGVGGGLGVAFHTPLDRRVAGRLSMGVGMRRLEHHDTFTVIRIPAEWPESRSTGAGTTVSSRDRGGPWAGLGMPIRITQHLIIEPEVKVLITPADENYSVMSFGIRTGWAF